MLEKYIKQLLNENDEVVVPKLGTFVAGYAGSEISGIRVAPPSKKIHFYEKLKSDKNELLRKRVTEAEAISISGFQEELDNLINRVEKELKESGSSHISHLGIIQKKPDGSLEFQQDEENLLDDSFGLPSLERKPLNKRESKIDEKLEDKTKQENETVFVAPLLMDSDQDAIEEREESIFDRDTQKETRDQRPIDTKDAALFSSLGDRLVKDPVEEEARKKREKEEFLNATSRVDNPPVKRDTPPPIIQVDREEEDDEDERRSSLVWWLVGIPILFAIAFLIYIFSDPSAMASLQALLGQKPVTTIVTTDTQTPITDNTADNTADNTTNATADDSKNTTDATTTDNTTATTDNTSTTNNGTDPSTQHTSNSETQPQDIVNDPKNRFYIVIGSFVEIENARKLRADLQGKGVGESKIVMYPKRGMYRVTVGDQASQREAYNQRNALGNAYPDMWVLNY